MSRRSTPVSAGILSALAIRRSRYPILTRSVQTALCWAGVSSHVSTTGTSSRR